MKLLLYLFLVVLCSFFVVSVEITEIMYNPTGSDTNREWIEIYSWDLVNLSSWTFYEANTHHRLTPVNTSNRTASFVFQGYAVIVDNAQQFLQDYPGYNGTLFDSSWSSLSNSGESLALYNQSGEVDVVAYDKSWGGASGYSLEKIELGIHSSWVASLQQNGTPGMQNSVFDSCDWSLNIITKGNVVNLQNQSAVVAWKINLTESNNKGNTSFLYWVEDAQGNVIKKPIQKFANNSRDFGWYQKTIKNVGGYVIKAGLQNTSCFDINLDNDVVISPMVVSGVVSEEELGSSIKVKKATTKDVFFGEDLPVNLEIFRGDTAKYSIKVYVENSKGKRVSEVSTIHAKEKNTDYSLKIPLLLKDSCSYETGNYFIKVLGLGTREREKVKLKQKDCGGEIIKEKRPLTKFSFKFFEIPALVTSREKIDVLVTLQNDGLAHNYSLWGYVYKGSICYSCTNQTLARNSTLQQISLQPNEKDSVLFELPLDDIMKEGEYKVKVKLRKDSQKAVKEIIETIVVVEGKKDLAMELQQDVLHVNSNSITGAVVYESTSVKARNMSWLVVVVGFVVLCVVVFRKL